MEPRSIERGEAAVDWEFIAEFMRFNGATFNRTWRGWRQLPPQRDVAASMEPRSIERGEGAIEVIVRREDRRLQWSHVQSNVESRFY